MKRRSFMVGVGAAGFASTGLPSLAAEAGGKVQLNEKDVQRLRRGLVGNVFSPNPKSIMAELALTPTSRPFPFTSKTILHYAVENQMRSAKHLVDMQGIMNIYFVLIRACTHCVICKIKYQCY